MNTPAQQQAPQLLLLPEVAKLTRLSPTTIWRLEAQDKFPKRVRIGLKRVAWSAQEIQSWLEHRMAARQVAA